MRSILDRLFGWMSGKSSASRRSAGSSDGNGRSRATPPVPRSDDPMTLDHYEKFDIPRKLNYPDTTLGRLIDQAAERFPTNPAIVFGDKMLNYHELLTQVNRCAGGLSHRGVKRGERVLMTLPNCPEFVITFFAAQKLGAIVVNAGPLMGVDDLEKLMTMTDPKLIIALDLQEPPLCRIDNGQRPHVWVTLEHYQTVFMRLGYRVKRWKSRSPCARAPHHCTFAQLLANAPARPPTIAPDVHDVALLQPTGGTTGTLKVAELTHRNLLANVVQSSSWVALREGQERQIVVLPMFHVYGLTTCLLTSVYNAGLMIPMARFRVNEMLDLIRRYKPTVLPLVPAIIDALNNELAIRFDEKIAEVIRHALVITGAAALPPAVAQRFEQLTGGIIHQGYGLTEASPITHASPPHKPRPGSIGMPLSDTLVRIVNLADHHTNVPKGEPGEMLISGPQIMRGYHNNPEETAKVLSVDHAGRRWLHTGDVVRVDDEGYFHVIDRCKDMINRAGLKIWPGKIEHLLLTHPNIADAAVFSRNDPRTGEIAVAAVVPRNDVPDPKQLATELRELCREHLAPYEVPGDFDIVKQLPRNALGKLQRFRLINAPDPDADAQRNEASGSPADDSDKGVA